MNKTICLLSSFLLVVLLLGLPLAAQTPPEQTEQEPEPTVEAVDTVGAGDCFCGWLAACLAEGKDFAACIDAANRAAALSVTRRGAQPSMPFRDELPGVD